MLRRLMQELELRNKSLIYEHILFDMLINSSDNTNIFDLHIKKITKLKL